METILKALAAENNECGIPSLLQGHAAKPGRYMDLYFDMVPEEYEIREGQPDTPDVSV